MTRCSRRLLDAASAAGMVEKFREGKATKDDVLVGNDIFKDHKSGDRQAPSDVIYIYIYI